MTSSFPPSPGSLGRAEPKQGMSSATLPGPTLRTQHWVRPLVEEDIQSLLSSSIPVPFPWSTRSVSRPSLQDSCPLPSAHRACKALSVLSNLHLLGLCLLTGQLLVLNPRGWKTSILGIRANSQGRSSVLAGELNSYQSFIPENSGKESLQSLAISNERPAEQHLRVRISNHCFTSLEMSGLRLLSICRGQWPGLLKVCFRPSKLDKRSRSSSRVTGQAQKVQ